MLFRLFITFFKIGLFTFGGGYAMIPLIEREVIAKKRWIERQDFLDMLVLAQSTPGPIAVNTAVFVGYKCRGYKGALAAIMGVVIPSFVIILAVAMFFHTMRDNRWVDAAFRGMRPAVVALIVAPIVGLAKGLHWTLMAVAAATALVVWHFGFSPVWLLVVGAMGGALWVAKKGKEIHL